MTENKRYKVAIYDEKAISGYCVLDLENPSRTARLKYKNVYIGTEDGCNIVCDLLNALHEENIQLKGEVAHYKLLLMSLEKEAKRLSQIKR